MWKILGIILVAAVGCFGLAVLSVACDKLVDAALDLIGRIFHRGQI